MSKATSSWDDWNRHHRVFPGVSYCVELLKRRNVVGEFVDTICDALEHDAAAHTEELLVAADDPENYAVRIILLGVIENAGLESAIPMWSRILDGTDEIERAYAIRALRRINTKQSRQILWDANELARSKRRHG